jgi:hypothetical protein
MTENEILEELLKIMQSPPVDNNQNGGLTINQLANFVPGYGIDRIRKSIKLLEDNGTIEHVQYKAVNIAKRPYWGDAYRLVKK